MEQAAADFAALRESLVAAFEALEGGRFRRDKWKSALGAGESAVIEDGAFFERAGINFSRVAGRGCRRRRSPVVIRRLLVALSPLAACRRFFIRAIRIARPRI